jgi:hypothetical protein
MESLALIQTEPQRINEDVHRVVAGQIEQDARRHDNEQMLGAAGR